MLAAFCCGFGGSAHGLLPRHKGREGTGLSVCQALPSASSPSPVVHPAGPISPREMENKSPNSPVGHNNPFFAQPECCRAFPG